MTQRVCRSEAIPSQCKAIKLSITAGMLVGLLSIENVGNDKHRLIWGLLQDGATPLMCGNHGKLLHYSGLNHSNKTWSASTGVLRGQQH